VVSFDEPGDAGFGAPPDDDYADMRELRRSGKAKGAPTVHDVRRYTLWGTILAGGAGVEYYFGYKLPENDLVAEDWRSRDESWDYARHCLEIFHREKIPFWEMRNRDDLVGNPRHDNSRYCFAKEGEVYVVYLPEGGETTLAAAHGDYAVSWIDPRTGRVLLEQKKTLGQAGFEVARGEEFLLLLRRQ
jgi:hypothetical protein